MEIQSAKDDRTEQERWDSFYLDEMFRLEERQVEWAIQEHLEAQE